MSSCAPTSVGCKQTTKEPQQALAHLYALGSVSILGKFDFAVTLRMRDRENAITIT